jgi:hypothetical protein
MCSVRSFEHLFVLSADVAFSTVLRGARLMESERH